MKKVILVFDGTNFSEGAFEFARKLNELQPILLTGVFLPQTELANLWSYAYAVSSPVFVPLVENDESELINKNIERFEKLCQSNVIDYRVHKDFFYLVLPELKKESNYADLLILGSEVFYKGADFNLADNYLQEALHGVKCSVVIVPEKFDFPESIILSYDGSEDAVFAIKQFAYLFPELTGKQTVLVYASDDAEEEFPDKMQMEELAARHFKNLSFLQLVIDPKKYFSTWISENKSAMLVSGSYGRSGFSQLFKKSFIKDVIADHQLPVFIAHK